MINDDEPKCAKKGEAWIDFNNTPKRKVKKIKKKRKVKY